MFEYPFDFNYGRRLDNIDYEALGVRDVWFYRNTIIMLTSFDMEINGYFKRSDYEYRYPTVYGKYGTFLFKCLENVKLKFNDGLSDAERDSFKKEVELEGYSVDKSLNFDIDNASFNKDDLLAILIDNEEMFFDVKSLKGLLSGITDYRIPIYYILPKEADSNTTEYSINTKLTQNNFIPSECNLITNETECIPTEVHDRVDSESEEPNWVDKKCVQNSSENHEEINYLKGNPGTQGLWGPRDELVKKATQFMKDLIEKCNCRCRHNKLANIAYQFGNNGGSYEPLDIGRYNLLEQFKKAALKIVPEERQFGNDHDPKKSKKYNPETCNCDLEEHKKFKPEKN